MAGKKNNPVDRPYFAHNRSRMADAFRAVDWDKNPLGPIEDWSPTLRTAVGIVLDAVGPKVLLWGPDHIAFYNDACLPTLGADAETSIGESYPTLRGSAWPAVRDHVEAALAGDGQIVTEQHVVARGGGRSESGYFTVSYNPVHDEEGRVAGVMKDVVETTAARHVNDALAADNKRFREMFDQAPVFLVLTEGPDLLIQYANREFLTLVGGKEIVGLTVAEAMPEAESQGFIALMQKVYSSGETMVFHETPVQLERDGVLQQTYLDFIYQPIRNAEKKITGVLSAGSDVTHQRLATDRADRLQNELAHAARLSAMGTMAATLAHELNQPLTAAGNYLAGSQLMLGTLRGDNKDAVQAALRHSERQIRRAGEIIRHARSFVGTTTVAREVVSIDTLIAHTLLLLEATTDCSDVAIRSELAPDDIVLLVDPVQIEQVLLNLTRNACQAMLGCDSRELGLSGRSLGDGFAEIVVRDTGRGVSPEELDTVFHAFTGSTTGGLGLGLSLCRALVEAHGGKMWAKNNPDVGASFHFTLPLAQEEPDLERVAA
jgi:two-component system sensor kinase FixL